MKKGESKPISFTISPEDLKFYNANLKWVNEPGEFVVMVGTDSQNVKEKRFELK